MTERKKTGGARPGAGRPKGVPNKKTAAQAEAVAKSGMTPLQFMLRTMRDSKKTHEQRMDAAKGAAPYVHARLSNVEMSANITTHEESIEDLA